MTNVGLASFTTRLTQIAGVRSLHDLATSPMEDEFIGENLGMSTQELQAFSEIKSTAQEILGVAPPSPSPRSQQHRPSQSQQSSPPPPPPPPSSHAAGSRPSRVISLDEDFGSQSSGFVDHRQPLRIVLDEKLKVKKTKKTKKTTTTVAA